MRINFSFLFLFLCLTHLMPAQRYMVEFADKNKVSYDPYSYLSEKAIERRLKHGISLFEETDFPVRSDYIEMTTSFVDSILGVSRWFNALFVIADEENIAKLEGLTFVKNITELPQSELPTLAKAEKDDKLTLEDLELLDQQIEAMKGLLFVHNGISGKGVRVAVFDAGFPDVDTHGAFEHLRVNNRIVETYDFIRKTKKVYHAGRHGTMVLSCIAGLKEGRNVGLATEAEFLLARTEHMAREPYREEQNWLMAAEWADKNGADIINSSLGYGYHRYFKKDINGHTSLVAKAANMAASKGILVVNAAGNEGTKEWKTLITPADADSVLSVGGISPATMVHTSFSSYGPTFDKKLKPNVCAMGHVIAATDGGKYTKTQGTSFSSPLVAGFAACVLQQNPQLKAMELFEEIQKCGSLYPYYDYVHGYGVPDATYFFKEEVNPIPCPFELEVFDNALLAKFKEQYIENELNTSDGLLFYHIEGKDGLLKKYGVKRVYSDTPLSLAMPSLERGEVVRVHFDKWTKTYKIEE